MGGGHGATRPTKYFSIDDIPDSMVKTYSKRDPNNMLYKTRRWVDFKKEQILYTQPDGVPIHLRTPRARFVYYGLWTGSITMLFVNIWVLNKNLNKKK